MKIITSEHRRDYKKGMTIFEIVIYVALFAICFSTIMMTVFSMQKTIIRIAESRKVSMINMYIYEYVRYRLHGGEDVTAEDANSFARKVSPYLGVTTFQIDSFEKIQNDFVEIKYKVDNKPQEIKIDMI